MRKKRYSPVEKFAGIGVNIPQSGASINLASGGSKDIAGSLLGARNTPSGPLEELGVMGAKISHGYVYEDFLPVLQGGRGRRTLREMSDNDPTVSAILFAIEMVLRSVKWDVKKREADDEEDLFSPADFSKYYTNTIIQDKESAIAFVKSVLFKDMEHTWDDFIGQVLTMLIYGWQYSEIVWKRRVGPFAKDIRQKSNYSDGLIGIRKLADRSQETLERWVIDDHGTIYGMVQEHPYGGSQQFIPYDRALHFRPKTWKGSPEGKSAIRGAYRPWFFKKNMEEIEAIAQERELNGFPVIKAPSRVINGTSPAAVSASRGYEKMVRDIKFNEQGGAVIPSDPWFSDDGEPSNLPQVELMLLSSDGSRAIDIDKTIQRYDKAIARIVLADFIMLGSDGKGSYALSKDKTDLFILSLHGWLESIASVVNRDLLPRLWQRNNIDPAHMPILVPGAIAPEDLGVLGKYVTDLVSAGMFMADEGTENHLREAGGLPEKDPDAELIQPVVVEPEPVPEDNDA